MLHLATRRLLPAAGALALAASLTACGGGPGDDAPTDASQEDFCSMLLDERGYLTGTDLNVDDVNAWAEDLAEVGTPEGLDGDAREGFEIFVNELADASEDDIEDSADGPKVSDDDYDKVQEFVSSDTVAQCAPAPSAEAPSDAPS
jgi:hypothetical protein